MIHNATSKNPLGDHYAAGISATPASEGPCVLAQLQQAGEQVRVPLTVSEARHFAQLLLQAADQVAERGWTVASVTLPT
jgi:hypothetical protein